MILPQVPIPPLETNTRKMKIFSVVLTFVQSRIQNKLYIQEEHAIDKKDEKLPSYK